MLSWEYRAGAGLGQGWKFFLLGLALIFAGSFLAHRIQTMDGIRVQDVRFTGTDGTPMSGLLYIPRTASAQHPAPGILAVHGYINSRETQDGFAIAFARSGYVVLAIDQTGHGYSGAAVAANGYGGPDGLKYLRSLDIVDKDNIGLEGHSMGGWAVLQAAASAPNDYKAMVLEGSGTGVRIGPARVSPDGTPDFPRNLAVVYSRYDEFAPVMWRVARAADVGNSAPLKALFGADATVKTAQLYGDIASGTARMLYTPSTTHPGDHISPEAVGDAVEWFGRTLTGGSGPRTGGIWLFKEVGTGIAFIGVVLLMLGAFDLYLKLPAFTRLAQTPEPVREPRRAKWWLLLAVIALVPVITFYPFLYTGQRLMVPSPLFPQSITNQILIWTLFNGLITVVASLLLKGPEPRFNARTRGGIAIACLTVGTGYLALLLMDFLFKVDFRFWVVALKLMSPRQFGAFLAYLVPFTIGFLIMSRALHAKLAVKGDSRAAQYWTGIGALAGGFALLLMAQYGFLFLTGALPVPAEALNAIISIQFLPLMTLVALIFVFTWRRTNSHLPGGFIAGLFVTWYIVAGTAMQFAG